MGDEESGRRSPGSAYGSPSYNGSHRGGGSLRGGSQKTTGAGSISSQHLFKSPPSSSRTGGGGTGGAMSSERDNHSNSHSTPQAEGKDYNDDNRTTSATPSPGTYLSPCYNIPLVFRIFFFKPQTVTSNNRLTDLMIRHPFSYPSLPPSLTPFSFFPHPQSLFPSLTSFLFPLSFLLSLSSEHLKDLKDNEYNSSFGNTQRNNPPSSSSSSPSSDNPLDLVPLALDKNRALKQSNESPDTVPSGNEQSLHSQQLHRL